MPLQLIDRYHPHHRWQLQKAIDAGRLRKCDELELLEVQQLRPLARLSLLMFLIGGISFAMLTLAAYNWQRLHVTVTFWGVLLWLLINVMSYVIVLPLHEAIHGLMFLAWGGRPYFGAKLPLALYCGAKDQLFHRNQYLAVGLAPLIVITLVALLVTWYVPVFASYIILASVGNFAGAAGDVLVASRLLKQIKTIVVEDTEAGYRAWSVEDDAFH